VCLHMSIDLKNIHRIHFFAAQYTFKGIYSYMNTSVCVCVYIHAHVSIQLPSF